MAKCLKLLWFELCTNPRRENKRQSDGASIFQCKSNIALFCWSIHRSPIFSHKILYFGYSILHLLAGVAWYTWNESKKRINWRTCIGGVKGEKHRDKAKLWRTFGRWKACQRLPTADKFLVPQIVPNRWLAGRKILVNCCTLSLCW